MDQNPLALESRVLFEDNHLLVVNKRSGELAQGDKTRDETILDLAKNYLKAKYNKPGNVFIGLPHRLDRPTSGVLVLTKTGKALSRLSEQFKKKEQEKIYWAITEKPPHPEAGVLEHFLWKDRKKNKSFVVDKNKEGAKLAVLQYAVKAKSDRYVLVEVDLKTGRHHQIRVQLAHKKAAIKGDLKYGAKRSNQDGSICLHARKFSLIHPVKKERITFVAPPPSDNLWKSITSLLS